MKARASSSLAKRSESARFASNVRMFTEAEVDTAGDADLRLQAIGLILNLLAILRRWSRASATRRPWTRGGFAEQRLLVAEADVHRSHHRSATRLLGEHHQLQSIGQCGANHARLDVLRGGIERLALLDGCAALVILEARRIVRRGRNLGAVRRGSRNEFAQRAVGRLEIGLGNAGYVGDVTLLTSSRSRKKLRQSPSPAYPPSIMAMDCELVSASSMFFRMRALARSTSS